MREHEPRRGERRLPRPARHDQERFWQEGRGRRPGVQEHGGRQDQAPERTRRDQPSVGQEGRLITSNQSTGGYKS